MSSPLHPPLHDYAIGKLCIRDRDRIVVENTVRERRTDGVWRRKVFRTRSRNKMLTKMKIEMRVTYALMKFRISPTVCVKFILATILVPSASLICTLVVGRLWSTSNFVEMACGSVDAPAVPDVGVADMDADALVGGNAPGMDELVVKPEPSRH